MLPLFNGRKRLHGRIGRISHVYHQEYDNYQLDGEAYVNGRWESLSLEEMYPTRWESGHRYQRGPFRRSKIRMRTLAASTCHRDARDPKAVRFIQKRWKRRLGTTDQSIRDPEVKVLLSWDCQTPWPLQEVAAAFEGRRYEYGARSILSFRRGGGWTLARLIFVFARPTDTYPILSGGCLCGYGVEQQPFLIE